jgi:NitT/TauT family transport system substrate-binding protein
MVGCQPVATTPVQPDEASSGQESLPDLGTIRIGHLPILSHGLFAVAQEKGYFAEQGLTVDLVPFQNGGAMVASLSIGDLDLGAGEMATGLFNAINQGLDIRLGGAYLAVTSEEDALYMFARKDLYESGEITSLADAAGRKIAVNAQRGLAEFLVNNALSSYGLTVDDVEMIVLPFPEIPGALANGAVDIAYITDPLTQRIRQDGSGVVLVSGNQISGNRQLGSLMLGRRLLEPANEEITIRLITAIYKAVRQDLDIVAYTDAPDVVEILMGFTSLPQAAIEASRPFRAEPSGQLSEEDALGYQSYYLERGYVDYTEPLAFEQFYEGRFVEEAIRRLEAAGE